MHLKRKRSESEFSFSSSSTFSSPPRPDHFGFSAMLDSTSTSPIRPTARSLVPSRTRKRFRDSRPSEQEVHQRTLNKLYAAQKQQQQQQQQEQLQQLSGLHLHQSTLSTPSHSRSQPQASHQPQGSQASLHNFWALPSAPPSSPAGPPHGVAMTLPTDGPTECEDCGLSTAAGDAGDAMMDMDLDPAGPGAETGGPCAGCGKHVCSHCSITDLGQRQRRCLICAGRKVWVGGAEVDGCILSTLLEYLWY
ncbi:hypothetical protein F5B20DRAFT_583054 [Whalleya microplaca]|nr:hypothetical protein F5B20DRAFT_583054 [Whalleya microplaca]